MERRPLWSRPRVKMKALCFSWQPEEQTSTLASLAFHLAVFDGAAVQVALDDGKKLEDVSPKLSQSIRDVLEGRMDIDDLT